MTNFELDFPDAAQGPQQESKDAYWQEMGTGRMPKSRKKIFDIVKAHAPITGNEIHDVIQRQEGEYTVRHNVSARLWELWDTEMIRKNGVRRCRVTGRNVTEWAPTGRTNPKKLKRPRKDNPLLTENLMLAKENSRLRLKIRELENEVVRLSITQEELPF